MDRRKFFSLLAAAPVAAVVPMPEHSNGGAGPYRGGLAGGGWSQAQNVRYITVTMTGGGGGRISESMSGGGGGG